MARLNRSVLPGLAPHAQPLVRPGEAGAGILHFGISAFHRAHQAVYTEEAIAEGGGDWAIVEVAPSSHDVLGALRAQEMLYSVLTVDGTEATARVVGAFDSGLHARDEPGAVLRRIADPAIRVVTFTVTEKAYAPGSAVLDLLVRGLRLRETPLALVSCDNLNNNGERLRDLVGTALQDPDVMALLSFPGTMVDRIVPATTPQSLATVETLLGARDEAAVVGEPFRQWVVQDDFPGGRPAWERAGVVLTTDTAPYELRKLRALNGVHSALAYLGALAGEPTIDRALALPGARGAMERFVACDIAPTITALPVIPYGEQVLERFANAALGYRTLQVAGDGSQKLPQRILGTVADRRAAGAVPEFAALVLAAWIRFVGGRADDGTELPLDDPLAAQLRTATPQRRLELLSPGLADDAPLRAEIDRWLRDLERHGAAATLAAL
ncbi:mannitol dehydrogenase family protein [Dactylosporangium sp. NBC_01737]|uniref:mannitol dehydrogenase family protein n=1 Tax=Dactylosporangium sp. NBC_01737 TaxID=2975959 RepID=UPI002E0E2002|nr:mannitol dehydrogenase family protein [Dactylosporangium sp. NBC_01737]